MKRRAVDAREVRQDEAQNQVHHGPNKRADQIPKSDVQLRFAALGDRNQELDREEGHHDGNDDEDRPRKFSGLKSRVVAQKKRNQPSDQPQVPHPDQPVAPLAVPYAHPGQARHDVIAQSDEQRGKRAPNHAVDVQWTQSSKGQILRGAKVIRVVEKTGYGYADAGCDHEPKQPRVEPFENELPVDQRIGIGECILGCCCIGHVIPPCSITAISNMLCHCPRESTARR